MVAMAIYSSCDKMGSVADDRVLRRQEHSIPKDGAPDEARIGELM